MRGHDEPGLSRCLAAEGIGTAFLLTTVVGSGIMAERLAGGNLALALLANAIATGAGLTALILALGTVSAHFNPAVTVVQAASGAMPWGRVGPYVVVQVLGAFAGVAAAHVMFGEELFAASTHSRTGVAQVFSEAVATLGLLVVVKGAARRASEPTAWAVGAYIAAAYWFTSSTSFANPAVTLARAFTDSFAGIKLADVPGFLLGQSVGTAVATPLLGWLWPLPHGKRASFSRDRRLPG